MRWVCCVINNACGFMQTLGVIDIWEGGESRLNDLFGCSHNQLQGLPFSSVAVSKSCYNGTAKDTLNSLCWAFLVMCVVFVAHEKLSVIWTPRNFMLWTILTGMSLMIRGVCLPGGRLKSIISSFVLSSLRKKLVSAHQLLSCDTSSLYEASLFSLISPTTIVSPANLMMWFECVATQSWVKSVNSRGLSTQPWGTPSAA